MGSGEEGEVGHSHHLYVPKDLELPGFVPSLLSPVAIIGVFSLTSLLIISAMWIVSGWFGKISKFDRILMCWWIFTGLIHIFVEGYYVFTPDFYAKTAPIFLAELLIGFGQEHSLAAAAGKLYSAGDSRYAARQSTVVGLEVLSPLIWGPASLLATYAIAMEKSYRYVIQLAVSLGQLYCTLIGFLMGILEGDEFASSLFSYYAYCVVPNSIWIMIPIAVSIHCWKKICFAVQVQQQTKKTI